MEGSGGRGKCGEVEGGGRKYGEGEGNRVHGVVCVKSACRCYTASVCTHVGYKLEFLSATVLVPSIPQGIEVLHFYQGRPLCTLPLSSYHATHADIDGDKTIEHVHAVVQAEEGQGEEQEEEEELGTDCYGQAVRSTGKVGHPSTHPPPHPPTHRLQLCTLHAYMYKYR